MMPVFDGCVRDLLRRSGDSGGLFMGRLRTCLQQIKIERKERRKKGRDIEIGLGVVSDDKRKEKRGKDLV